MYEESDQLFLFIFIMNTLRKELWDTQDHIYVELTIGCGWTQYELKMLAKHIKDGLLISMLEEQH